MLPRHIADRETAVGAAYCGYIPDLLSIDPGILDYVEVPFEMLLRTKDPLDSVGDTPVVLHCASLSLAGNVPISDTLRERLREAIARTETPWVGEHLAFVRTQESKDEPSMADAVSLDTSTGRYNVGYTVSPQYSPIILDRVLEAVTAAEDDFGLPVLLENGPLYVELPGSTMSQAQFMRKLCECRPETKILMDLSHLEITAHNTGKTAHDLLAEMPVESVVEVHLSGHSVQSGMHWDDHARRVPEVLFELLDSLMQRVRPRAITLEYNWDSNFPLDVVREDIDRVKRIVDGSRP